MRLRGGIPRNSGHLVFAVLVPSLVDVFERLVYFPEFGGQQGKVPAGICGDLLATMDAGVFLNVGSDVLRDRVVVSEEVAKEFLHWSRFFGFVGPVLVGTGLTGCFAFFV